MSEDSQVGKLDIVLNADASRVSGAVDQVNQKLDTMMQKAKTTSQSVGQSNAKLIDSFEGIGESAKRVVGSIDRLGAKTDELMGKQHTAWTAIGAVVGGTTQSMIQKITAFLDKAAQIPAALEAATRSMNQDAWTKGDALRVANDELENQIAILEKTPENNLALGLDQARLRADALAASIQVVNDKTEKALAANHIAGWKRLLGEGPTANVEGTINSFNQQIQDAANERQSDLHDGLLLSAAEDDKRRRSLLEAAHTKYQQELNNLKDGKYNDNGANRSMLLMADAQVVNEQDEDTQGDRSDADKARLKRDQAAQRAREQAQAAQQKADQAQMTAFRGQLSGLQQTHRLALGEELAFWQERLNTTKQGSANYIAIYEKLGSLSQAMLEKKEAQIAEQAKKRAEEIKQFDEAATRLVDEMDRADHRAADAVASYNEAVGHNADAMREMMLTHDVSTGAISRHDAAVQTAAAHAADYAGQLAKLQQQQEDEDKDGSLLPEQRLANKNARAVKVQEVTGESERAAVSDQWAIQQATAIGGFKEAIDEFVVASKDASAQMRELASSTLNSVNDTLLEQMTGRGKRGDWTRLGQSVFSNVAGAGLKKAEGALLQGFGFGGKADGSQASPFWIRSADLAAKSASSGLQGLLSGASAGGQGGSDEGSADGGGGGFGKALAELGPIASNIIPFMADGGDFSANSMAVVGERGPELVRFGRSGSVTSNSDLGGLGGDTHHHTWNIDARGASDPAQIRAAVQRGISEAAPHLMAGSVHAMQEYQKRRPSSKR